MTMTTPLTWNVTNTTAPISPPASPVLTRSQSAPAPAIVEPACKCRKIEKALTSMGIEEVWEMTDAEIVAAALKGKKLTIYDHYDIQIECRGQADDPKHTIFLVFICETLPDQHTRQYQEYTQNTTSNLKTTMDSCKSKNPTLFPATPVAASTSFKMVGDELYLREVELLRPGTKVPSEDTVANDVQRLYKGLSFTVKSYFENQGREVHAIVNGWTVPITKSYLGVEIILDDGGQIHNATLEFIRLTESHTGAYLAEQLYLVLKCYGLDRLLHVLMMDNAAPKKKKVRASKGSVKCATSGSANVQPDEVEEIVVGGHDDDANLDTEDLEIANKIEGDGGFNESDPA
ncbi:hypothetical protein VKT23_017322 [Stygiomarasmius scandens]|uniref:Uncharacterized protein n=1 Tax=Marasmiellus scandens TaxID=2682957 RepID=A0ABR1IWZ0_9AGAR